MTQEEFDKAPLLDQILYDTTGMLVENHPSMAEAMDKYHQAKLKLLGIAETQIGGIMVDFLDSIRAYEHESGKAIHYDERESSEFVDIYFNGEGKLKIEEQKPLFITEDGVEIYINNVELFAVNSTFITASDNNFDFEVCKKEGWKLFFHKSNADEYILWNKPLLSLQEIDATIKGYLPEFDELRKLAEERVE